MAIPRARLCINPLIVGETRASRKGEMDDDDEDDNLVVDGGLGGESTTEYRSGGAAAGRHARSGGVMGSRRRPRYKN